MRGFRNYDKQELFNYIDRLSIEKQNGQIITKYNDHIIKVANVSNRYEIFDIGKYLKDKIEMIEENFTISKYDLVIKGGKQTLELLSDVVEIGGVDFHKSFYIVNSTDKSRRLSFNIGLRSGSRNFYMVGLNNASLIKKHLKGVTQAAEEASKFDGESFNEQVDAIQNLVGHRVQFSKIRQIILGDSEDIPKINHRKFDAFKNSIRYANSGGFTLNDIQKRFMMRYSENINDIPNDIDFYIDAFWAFQMYLRLFNREDAHIVKKETERIMKITQWSIRNSVLESLGI